MIELDLQVGQVIDIARYLPLKMQERSVELPDWETFQRRLIPTDIDYTLIIKSLLSTQERRDPYTAGHERRVAEISCSIAKQLGLNQLEIKVLEEAALVHDIGKMGIPVYLLKEPKLSEEDFAKIKTHPWVGRDILKEAGLSLTIVEIATQHHERLDGSGYPIGLRSNEISDESKIIAVADTVDAMTGPRPYRQEPPGIDKALRVISNRDHYDQEVSEAYNRCLQIQQAA